MINISKKSNCSGCYACVNICPKNCIIMKTDDEGFWYPYVDSDNCLKCGLCEKVCPIIHKWQSDESRSTIAMAAANLNDEIRLTSSSGGIFTLIAEEIIAQGGVVFGAAFSEDFKSVQHICVDKSNEIEKLRGSKYLQSAIGETYKQAKQYLDDGRLVLFTGTPCQIGGLYAYLKHDYEKLYTQDIICHGVPSSMMWKKYLSDQEQKVKSKVSEVFFRNKESGWNNYSLLINFENKKIYQKIYRQDSYMKAFLSDICLRPSCYSCSFKGIKRQADITLADFWGIESVFPDLDDDKGTSLVLFHSDKGNKLLDSVREKMACRDVAINEALRMNPSSTKSPAIKKNRAVFIRKAMKKDFEKTVQKYTKKSYIIRLRVFIGKIKNKIIKR